MGGKGSRRDSRTGSGRFPTWAAVCFDSWEGKGTFQNNREGRGGLSRRTEWVRMGAGGAEDSEAVGVGLAPFQRCHRPGLSFALAFLMA